MRARTILLLCLSFPSLPAAAAGHWTDTGDVVFASLSLPVVLDSPGTAGEDRIVLGSSPLPYYSSPSGLDRIDPSNMRVFGGEIGGNGVTGGAVVSLTWPTGP